MISRYMVLVASEQKLLMMRPYQIYAVKAIVECIHQNCGNGYIWHTTGSGKTLTSFKASTLLKDNPTSKNAFLWWIVKIWIARPAKNLTVFRKAA
jgi:type I site-specific restriction-modification system R (restriction) subunit